MKITTTQRVEGAAPGETIEVDGERAAWLVANGYATAAGGNKADFDGVTSTTVPADQDPTNATAAPPEPVRPKVTPRR